MKRILAIGNSFSQDSTRWLRDCAASAGDEIKVVNLYIGGCSLKRHADNLASGEAAYSRELNGIDTGESISIQSALAEDDWDEITVQQVSQSTGVGETYDPYLSELLRAIRSARPRARLWFHETWAYEIGSEHPGFGPYGNDQAAMYEAIRNTVYELAPKHGLHIIPSGDAIQALRALPEFDVPNGGLSLCRDKFHMSFDYGRFALALVWYKYLCGGDPARVTFAPDGTESGRINAIKRVCAAI